jgi:thiamine pyrophosphokinase
MIAPSPSLSDSMSQAKLQDRSRNGDGRETGTTSLETPKGGIGALPTLSPTRLDVLVLGGLGGRVDQAFSQIHHLYSVALHNSHQPSVSSSASIHPHEPKENKTRSHIRLFLLSEESISFILLPGLNRILTSGTNNSHTGKPSKAKEEGLEQDQEFYLSKNVGIIPLTGPATITTTGLEWDVTDWKTEIGGQISTSNHIRANEVNVTTTWPVLFTVEFAPKFKIGWEWKKEYC